MESLSPDQTRELRGTWRHRSRGLSTGESVGLWSNQSVLDHGSTQQLGAGESLHLTPYCSLMMEEIIAKCLLPHTFFFFTKAVFHIYKCFTEDH